jgi:hypothetical protein
VYDRFTFKGGPTDQAFEGAGNTPFAGITTVRRQEPRGWAPETGPKAQGIGMWLRGMARQS